MFVPDGFHVSEHTTRSNHLYDDVVLYDPSKLPKRTVDTAGLGHHFEPMAQGNAVPANERDLQMDEFGLTSKFLHRRIENPPAPPRQAIDPLNQELWHRNYRIAVGGVDSYRTTELYVHDEESETCEIP